MKRLLIILIMALSVVFSATVKNVCANQSTDPVKDKSSLSGKVIETMDSGRYTYVCLEKNGNKIWLAVPKMVVVEGQDMSFKAGIEMVNFESKTLKRKFDKIIFSAGPVQQGTNNEMKSPGSRGNVIVPTEKIEVEKATGPNAYTIGEIYKNKNSLDKQNIVVRGKVVKVSANIMGKNWIHLQDGSGDPKDSSHDIVVTSQTMPSVGDVVTASGTLYKDKDFGRGYKYDVIIEDASVTH
jgi:hypothetical protein